MRCSLVCSADVALLRLLVLALLLRLQLSMLRVCDPPGLLLLLLVLLPQFLLRSTCLVPFLMRGVVSCAPAESVYLIDRQRTWEQERRWRI